MTSEIGAGAMVMVMVMGLLAGLAAAARCLSRVRRRSVVRARLVGSGAAAGAKAVVVGGRRQHAALVDGPRWWRSLVEDAALPLAPARLWQAWVGGSALVLVIGVGVGGAGLAVVTGVAAVAGPLLALSLARGRSAARYGAGLPLVLEQIARSLRSGTSLLVALREAAEAAPTACRADVVAVAGDAATWGVGFALEAWRERRPAAEVALAVAALAMGAEMGGGGAQAIDGVAAGLRQRQAALAELRAASAQARLSAMVIAVAPVGFGAVVAASDPRAASFLVHTRAGLICVALALVLDALGVWWMAALTRPAPQRVRPSPATRPTQVAR